ncbi:RecB family exonuclease [Microbacterium sp.]|uniref:RecB family exonuclease n=1 Tax=Microbacterium sp. TaxID=51671 RepID=UPI003F9B50C8
MTTTPLLPDAAWTPDGALVLTDRSAAEKLRRKRMSISVATTLEQCPASFVRSLLPTQADPFGEREIGIEAHEVLDAFYQLPAASRTERALRGQVEQRADHVWAPEKITRRIDREGLYRDELADDPDYDTTARAARDKTRWIETVYASLLGVFSLEDPRDVQVEGTEKRIFTTVGEDVPITVTVDRMIRLPDGSLRVDDWKVASDKKLNPRDDHRDTYADQGRIYAHAIEQATGEKVSEMRLIFPALVGKATNADTGGSYRTVPLGEDETAESIEFLSTAWDDMHAYVDKARFPTNPSVLCGWCPLARSCPSAVIYGKKAEKNVQTLWTAEELGIRRLESAPRGLPAPAHEDPEAAAQDTSTDPRIEEAAPAEAGEKNGEIMSMPAPNVTPMRRPAPDAAPYLEYVEPTHPGAPQERNLASYGVQASFSFTGMAFRHLNATGVEPSPQTVAALAETFAMIIADVQFQFTNTTRLQHGLNPRLRGLLFDVLESHPFPLGKSLAEVEAWIQQAKTVVWKSAQIALALHDRQDDVRHSTAYQALASA